MAERVAVKVGENKRDNERKGQTEWGTTNLARIAVQVVND
jgi:hypothetical protein